MTDETLKASQNLIAELSKSGAHVETTSNGPRVVPEPAVSARIQTTIAPLQKPTTPGNPIAKVPVIALPVQPKPNVAGLVKAQVKAPAPPAGLMSSSTDTILDDSFFRAVLYGVTGAKKTSTAAGFDTSEYVKIILTRDKSQLIPLAGEGYKYSHCDTAAKFEYAMKYPEALWPEWAGMADPERRRTIIVDDLTKALDVLVKSAAVKDNRMAYRDAKNTLDDLITSLSSKPYNIILIALAKVGETIRDEEQIVPEMSPSLYNYVCSEFSAVLYVDHQKDKILTDRDKFGIALEDANGKNVGSKTRVLFAKHKLPRTLVGKGLIQLYEPRDLKAFWMKLKAAQRSVGK